MPSLHWSNKEQAVRAAAQSTYRLLMENSKFSYGLQMFTPPRKII